MPWSDESEIDETETEDNQETNSTENQNMEVDTLAPNAMSVTEAQDKEHQWKVMCWSNEGQGKTHFGYTMPEPVCIIDTENKADDIAHKFSGKKVHIWQPTNFDEAKEYRDEALSYLSEYMSQTGDRGTLVVDSMAVMWEWAKEKHIQVHYGNADVEDVNLDLQDWPPIKNFHNNEFRKPIENCDFHTYFTAIRKDDVGRAMDEDEDTTGTPDKPGGESTNVYKVNSIVRLRLDDRGLPVGDLQKSGLVRFKYIGLPRPTFPKHKEIVEEVQRIEAEGAESWQDVEQEFDLDYDVTFTEADQTQYAE